jgi:hypothetical protein
MDAARVHRPESFQVNDPARRSRMPRLVLAAITVLKQAATMMSLP